MRSEILGPLDSDQIDVVTFDGGDCLVLAGAGSGKTRSLQHRVAWLTSEGYDPSKIAAFSFTRKASKELTKRIVELCPDASESKTGTFHSICFSFLKDELDVVNVIDNSEAYRFIASKFSEVGWDSEDRAKYVYGAIAKAKSMAIPESDFMDVWVDMDREKSKKISSLYRLYEGHKRSNGLIDFPDMIWKFWKLLERDSFKEEIQSIFEHVIIDEAQDLNKTQLSIADSISKKSSLMCVGDIRQSLYGFRGADVEHLEDMAYKRGMERIYLTSNYRSCPQIVDASNKLISNGKKESELPDCNPVRTEDGSIESFVFDNCKMEAEFVANLVRKDIDGGMNCEDIACVYRVNAQSQYLESSFNELDIPYYVTGNGSFFNQPEILDAISYLKIAISPTHGESLRGIFNSPTRFLGQRFWSAFSSEWSEGQEVLSACNNVAHKRNHWNRCVGSLISDIAFLQSVASSGADTRDLLDGIYGISSLLDSSKDFLNLYSSDSFSGNRKENLIALKDIAAAFPDPSEFISFCNSNRVREMANEDDSDKVNLMTVHRSKGTEYKKVYFVGLSEKIIPHPKSSKEEERRCAYVGITRACDNIVMTSSYNVFGKEAGPSRFFDEMGISPSPPHS